MPSFVGGVLLSPYKWLLGLTVSPPKRAHAVVPVPRVVVVQGAVRVDDADVVGVRRIRRYRAYPICCLFVCPLLPFVAPPFRSHSFDLDDKRTPILKRFCRYLY